MIFFRLLLILTAIGLALCVGGFLLSRDRRYLGWARRIVLVSGITAIVFFTVLIIERLAA